MYISSNRSFFDFLSENVFESESLSVVSDLWCHVLQSPWNSLVVNTEWVAIPFSGNLPNLMDQIQVSHIAGGILY